MGLGSMESSDKSAAMVVSAVFNTREHFDSGTVFWKSRIRPFK